MRTITVSDVRTAIQTKDGWGAFLSVMDAMVEYHSAVNRVTDADSSRYLGQPGFPSKELDELHLEQQTQAQFEAMAAMADFINKVAAAGGGGADGGP